MIVKEEIQPVNCSLPLTGIFLLAVNKKKEKKREIRAVEEKRIVRASLWRTPYLVTVALIISFLVYFFWVNWFN